MNFLDRYDGLFLVRDNFLPNYSQVISDSQLYDYLPDSNGVYPGIRTKDLAGGYGDSIIKNVMDVVAPDSPSDYVYSLHFHKNLPYDDSELNQGWIHSDPSHLTGLIYLTPSTIDETAGTSFFAQYGIGSVQNTYRDFLTGKCSRDDYLLSVEKHNSFYREVLNIPFITNRLVVFDSKQPHRPNSYKLTNGQIRHSILFYINFLET